MRHVEDVTDAVVLFLVDLVGLQARERHAVVIDRHPDFEENVRIVMIDDFGADNAGIRPVGLFDHQPGRIGVEHDVVVAEQQEHRALDRGQRLVGRGGERAGLRAAADERAGQRPGDPVGRIRDRSVVEHQHRQRRIVLGSEGREALLEPRSGVVRDHDRDHGRDHLGRFGLVVTLEQLGADRVGVDRLHEAGRG